MATDPQPKPAGPPESTASHPAASGSSSLVPLSPINTDNAPTVITTPHSGSAPMVAGGKLGHFELIEAIGAGGMAAVLKARDLELGRIVALKILPPSMARDAENVIRFKQEARAAARLDHDNIARVFFCGEDRGQHFIAFEYVEGDNLRVLIDRHGPLPVRDCVQYMAQIAAGLAHAAARGVVHRDVKPSNIIITPDGKAKLVDMGLARSLEGRTINGGVTRSGVTLGTFDYISPEQALDPRRADTRSDLYSLGCAFYHALTGRPPVPEGTAAKKLQAHRQEPALDPRVLNPAIPDDLAIILARLMAKDPARRYQTPGDLIADLTALAQKLDVSLDGVSAVSSPAAHRLATEPPSLPLGWAAAAAALVVAVAVLAGTHSSGPSWTDFPLPAEPRPNPQVRALDPPPAPIALPTTARPSTAEELAHALQSPNITDIRLTKGQLYDLSALGYAVTINHSVTIVGVPGVEAPVLRVAVGSRDDDTSDQPGTLTLSKGDQIRFEGVRFKLTDAIGVDDLTVAPAGVLIAGAKHAVFDSCWFEAPDLGAVSAAGLAATGPLDLTLTHCYFDVRRATGLRLRGQVAVKINETGFAPHQSAVELEASDDGPGQVRLSHCTFLLDTRGAAVRVHDGGRWDVSAGGCVFAAPPASVEADMTMMTPDPGEHRPAVFRVESDRPGSAARFTGRAGEPNAYFRVLPLVVGNSGASRGYPFDELRSFDPPPFGDPSAVELTQSPWDAADPIKDLTRPDPWRALRLRTTFRRVQIPAPDLLLGARFIPRRDGLEMYDAWPPKHGTDGTLNPREKVWWPTAEGRLGRNEFETLEQALAALRPGDTLVIKHDGPLALPPVTLDRSKSPITIRPHSESSRLVLHPPPGSLPDRGLFRVADGELTLEKLEFYGRAAVTVSGGRCTLRDCVISLPEEPAGRSAALYISEPGADMTRRPQVTLENCLIRGRGAGLWVPTARPLDFEVTHSLFALAGPLIGIGAPIRPARPEDSIRVSFTRMTALVTGPIIDLRPGRGSTAWIPVTVTSGRCLFSTPDPEPPAPILSVVPAPDGTDPRSYVKWFSTDGANWYDRDEDDVFIELVPADDTIEPTLEEAPGWQKYTGEKPGTIGRIEFQQALVSVADLVTAKPEQFLVTDGLAGADPTEVGADVNRVPRPTMKE